MDIYQSMTKQIRQICEDNNLEYISCAAVSGGDINMTYYVETTKGKYFLKLNAETDFPAMFEKEAEGLEALQKAALLKVPEVMAYGKSDGQQYLILQWLEKVSPSLGFWEHFAKGLAQLHAITNKQFGWSSSNYIGSLMQPNTFATSWAEFYTMQRIMPLVVKLHNKNAFSKADVLSAEKLCSRLSEIFPEERPALLHGDLWNGNFMAVKGYMLHLKGMAYISDFEAVPSVFDPAVYYGHREMDLGMSLLFGGFDPTFYEAYHSFFPLEKNWRKRTPLTKLYPLLVHAMLFSGAYITECKQILSGANY